MSTTAEEFKKQIIIRERTNDPELPARVKGEVDALREAAVKKLADRKPELELAFSGPDTMIGGVSDHPILQDKKHPAYEFLASLLYIPGNAPKKKEAVREI